MTRKRYEGLIRALFARIIEENKTRSPYGYVKPMAKGSYGKLYASVKRIDTPDRQSTANSYQAMWDTLLPIRKLYGMAEITK